MDEIDGVLETLRNDPAFKDGDDSGGGHGGPKALAKKILRKTKNDKSDGAASDSNAPDHGTTLKQLANALASLHDEHKNLVSAINAAGAGFPTDSEEGQQGAGGLGPSPQAYASRRAVGIGDSDATPTGTDGEGEDDESDGTFHDADGDGAVFVDLDEIEGEKPSNGGGKKGRSLSGAVGAVSLPTIPGIGRKGSHGGGGDQDDADDEDSDDDEDDDHNLKQAEKDGIEEDPVKRREQLPHPVAGDEFSMFSMLKKNVGKVGSHVSSLSFRAG